MFSFDRFQPPTPEPKVESQEEQNERLNHEEDMAQDKELFSR